jgi:acyl-CoA thioester hydrolase
MAESNQLTVCEIEIRTRYPECDPMGYVHHARFFEYFERGRTELLRLGGKSHRDLEAEGILFVVARAECKFLKPALYDDQLLLSTRVVRTTKARIDHAYVLRRGTTVLCLGSTTLACVSREGRLMEIPEEFQKCDAKKESTESYKSIPGAFRRGKKPHINRNAPGSRPGPSL